MSRNSFKTLIVGGFALALLGACTIQDGARTGLRALSETDGLIQFNTASFGSVARERISYSDTTERDEYALYANEDHQAEFIYITTRHLHLTNLVIDRLFDLDQAIHHFRHNQDQATGLGEAFKFAVDGIPYWGKSFQVQKRGQTCGAFSGHWDAPSDDLRAGKALFGYFCEPGKNPMTPEVLKQRVADVGIRGITANFVEGAIPYPVLTENPTQEVLKVRAQGAAGDTQGNTKFPYKAVRFFKREDSCRFVPDC